MKGIKSKKMSIPTSSTETYAAITLESSDPRWKGVRFLLEAGKALGEKKTELRVYFKRTPASGQFPRELLIKFSPYELGTLYFPGTTQFDLVLNNLHPDPYEAILEDIFSERLRYSVSFKEIEEQWRLADSMLSFKVPVKVYHKNLKPE